MRAIIAKLPYKLRERWRTLACGILDKEKRTAKFEDLVDFVNKQAKEALHPLFGEIKDSTLKGQAERKNMRRDCKEVGLKEASQQLPLLPLPRIHP